MPKKTKQAKIIAQLRRLQNNQIDPSEARTQEKVSVNLKEVSQVASTSEIKREVTSSDSDYSYVIKDLRKTIVFVVIAIIFQFALSVLVKNWF